MSLPYYSHCIDIIDQKTSSWFLLEILTKLPMYCVVINSSPLYRSPKTLDILGFSYYFCVVLSFFLSYIETDLNLP
jgi:hypothetical protein